MSQKLAAFVLPSMEKVPWEVLYYPFAVLPNATCRQVRDMTVYEFWYAYNGYQTLEIKKWPDYRLEALYI